MSNDFGMQYIMDGNGNYYTLNGENQLVVARDRDEATVFSFFEANQRIGGGRKSMFYHTIPVEESDENETDSAFSRVVSLIDKLDIFALESEEKEAQESIEEVEKEEAFEEAERPVETLAEVPTETSAVKPATNTKVVAQPEFEYSMEHVDWSEFANYFMFLVSGAKEYREELQKKLSDVDKVSCDLLHYVELYDLTDAEGLRAIDLLKDVRQSRRDVKNEMVRVDSFQRHLGISANAAKAKSFLAELKKIDSQKYQPRQLGDLFVGMQGRETDRDLYRRNRYEKEADFAEVTEVREYEEEDRKMSYSETVFDHKENDWLDFARKQVEFYQNAGQYMINLQIEIEEIDAAIEETMIKIEDANYNLAQGYKVFKELKELRNQRKANEKELETLRLMTECFDLDAMAEALAYNVSEMEKI